MLEARGEKREAKEVVIAKFRPNMMLAWTKVMAVKTVGRG